MKKHISLVLVAAMLLTTLFSNAVFAAFPDVETSNNYYKAILTLQNLGIVDGDDNGKFNPENQITRGEFTKMLICAMGYGGFTTEPTEFSDLKDHWARCYIKTAYDMKIVDGFDDGTFKPNDQVTYEQVLKMMVCAVGYQANGESKGGYPNGYISEADELGMTKGVKDQANNAPALRQVVAQVVYNSLEVNKQELQNNGKDLVVTNKTLLNDNLKAYKLRGTLVGVETNITNDCNSTLNKFQMAIKGDDGVETILDFQNYSSQMSASELAKYLGQYMNVYYKQESSTADKELLIVDMETTSNTSYTVSYNDIIEYDGKTFKYYLPDSSTRKTLKVDADSVTVRYNGQTLDAGKSYPIKPGSSTIVTKDEAVLEWLNPKNENFIYGEITLLDSGSTGDINILEINDYKYMVALKSPSTSDYRLQSKLKTGSYLDLTPDKADKTVYIEKAGKQIAATGIAANDIVSYTENLETDSNGNATILNLYVCSNNKVTGNVSSINESSLKITVAGKEYNMSSTFLKDVLAKEGKSITTGSDITAYTDKLGTIVYATISAAEEVPYGYIANFAYDPGNDDATMYVCMPTLASKGTKSYKTASKVRISYTNSNGEYVTETVTSNDDLASALEASAAYNNGDKGKGIYSKEPENTTYSQIARVKVNSSGEVSEIVCLNNTMADKQNEDTNSIAKSYPLEKYYYSSNAFKKSQSDSTLFSINSKTLVIYVPQNRNDRDSYAKRAASSATFSNGGTYWVEAYDVNSSRVSNILILYGTSGSVKNVEKSTNISVVGETPSQYYDSAEDKTVQKVSFYTASNTIKEWVTADDKEFADVVPGDVLQFGYDADNKIMGKKKVIDYSDIKSVLNGETFDVDGTSEIYNWNKTYTDWKANRNQKYVYDFRYPKSNVTQTLIDDNKYFETSSNGRVYTQACMYNVYDVTVDGTTTKLLVTKDGFNADTKQMRSQEELTVEDYTITSSTKLIRMEDNENEFSKFVEGTQTELTVNDLKPASEYGADCSKVLVCTMNGTARMIVVYK